MKFIEQIQTLERLDQLIRLKATGTPSELASRLNVSERTAYNLIEALRDLGVVISYCKQKKSYYYESRVTIQFLKVQVENTKNIQGGENKLPFFSILQNFCSDTSDICSRLTNTEEQNNAGDFSFRV